MSTGRRSDVGAITPARKVAICLSVVAAASGVPVAQAATHPGVRAPKQLIQQFPLNPQKARATSPGAGAKASTAPTSTAASRRHSAGKAAGIGFVFFLLGGVCVLALVGLLLVRSRPGSLARVFESGPQPARPPPPAVSTQVTLNTDSAVQSSAASIGQNARNGAGQGHKETAETDDGTAAFNLGARLEARGDLTAAEAAYRDADARGHGAAASNLGVLLDDRGDVTGAEIAYRRAAKRGDISGAFNLGLLLEKRGDFDKARTAYRSADRRGHPGAAANLGRLLEERGDLDGAQQAYQRAADRGDPAGAFNLGALLEERGDPAGAEAAYRRVREIGSGELLEMAREALFDLSGNS